MPLRSHPERRAREFAARVADEADEADNAMDIDEEPAFPTDQTGVEALGTNMTTGADDENTPGDDTEPNNNIIPRDPLNMTDIRDALETLLHERTQENLDALMRACYNDITTMLDLAANLNGGDNQQASNILFATAIMRIHQFVENSWHDVHMQQHESVKLHNIQWSHVQSAFRRLAALEAMLLAPPSSPAGSASSTAPLAAIEARLDDHSEVIGAIHRHGSQRGAGEGSSSGGAGMDAVLDRVKEVTRLREEAEADRFERADKERQERVDELDESVEELIKEHKELKEELENVKRQNRKMRTFFIAFLEGDLAKGELAERLKELDMY